MPPDVPIRCRCGNLRGVARALSPTTGNRVVCYCDDCQSFAHFLGRADEILDAHGGTDIFQTSPVRVEFDEGHEHLACMQLTPDGICRWYVSCCNTPVGNTAATSRLPFVGLVHTCLDHEAEGSSPDEQLGPVRNRVNARFARGDRSALEALSAHEKAPASMLFRLLVMVAGARLRGDHKRSPFFDANREPIATPHVLSASELAAVETARDSG